MTISVGESVIRCCIKFGDKVSDPARSALSKWQNKSYQRLTTQQISKKDSFNHPALHGAASHDDSGRDGQVVP
jgi:hypothetical protein